MRCFYRGLLIHHGFAVPPSLTREGLWEDYSVREGKPSPTEICVRLRISNVGAFCERPRLVDNSDLLVAYVNKDFGGAYNTLKYAEKKGVPIINVVR